MMQNTVRLDMNRKDLGLRLQVPVLTAARIHSHAAVEMNGENVLWSASTGELQLTGKCTRHSSSLWHLEFELENRGEDVEARVALPYLFYHFDQDLPVRVFNPLFGGVLEVSQVPIRISYPGPATFCMTAASGQESAFAIGLFNAEQRHVAIRHIPAGTDGQVRLVFERVLVKKGQKVALPTMFICSGRDWMEAMLPYKEWFGTAFKRVRPRPEWWMNGNFNETRKAHCLAPYNPPKATGGVWIFDDEGKPRTFTQVKGEIDEAATDGEKTGYKPLFYQFGWWQSMADIRGMFMFDSVCGDYIEAHELAKKTIKYIHSKGLKTYLYTNCISAGDETEVFKNHPELFVRDANGFPVYNEGYPMLMFCPGAPGIRDYWRKVLDYILKDLDADGFFLDQVGGGTSPHYCYDKAHGHAHTDTYGKDFVNLVDFIGEFARSIKPDCYIGGELVLDSRSILLDETHGIGYTGPKTPAPETLEQQKITWPSEYYVFVKYLCPEIFTTMGYGPTGLMNGGAGHHRFELWSKNRRIFESTCTPCHVEPQSGLAYLYGSVDGKVILAVRSHGEIGTIAIELPYGFVLSGELPAGLVYAKDGRLSCNAGIEPVFFTLECV